MHQNNFFQPVLFLTIFPSKICLRKNNFPGSHHESETLKKNYMNLFTEFNTKLFILHRET